MTTETVYSAFNRAWSHADLAGKYPGKVRVYDLRHRFASACLNRWLDDGENLMAMLPFLREYMGHKSLSETAYYIARLLFKLAVETNMMMNVLASEVDVSPEALERLRGRCIQEVKKTGGAVTFADALKYQKGE